MVSSKTLLSAFFAGILTSALFAQQKSAPLQSPREAMVEMLSGSEEKVRKHLTVEVQKKMTELMKDYPAGTDPVKLFIPSGGAQGTQRFDALDYGPILFALNDAEHHTRLEAHIDSDALTDDEDNMGVSLHSYRNGVEQEMPLAVSLVLNLKLQDSTWRLNAITFSATVPLGDPRILDKAFLNPLSLAALNADRARAAASAAQEPQSSKMTPLRAVRMISIAEDVYARRHPEQGYTCGISNLVNVGRGMEDGEVYHFMDPEFARGVYNGYRFQLTGCEGKPVRSFHIAAEPVNGRGKAYCSDDRHNLRMADDGKAASCLALGKIARQ